MAHILQEIAANQDSGDWLLRFFEDDWVVREYKVVLVKENIQSDIICYLSLIYMCVPIGYFKYNIHNNSFNLFRVYLYFI